jgi:hypothetical protein
MKILQQKRRVNIAFLLLHKIFTQKDKYMIIKKDNDVFDMYILNRNPDGEPYVKFNVYVGGSTFHKSKTMGRLIENVKYAYPGNISPTIVCCVNESKETMKTYII